MIERHRQERADLRRQHPSHPEYEAWLRTRGAPDLADQFRQQPRPAVLTGHGPDKPAPPIDIRDFSARVQGGRVAYFRGGHGTFIDRGRVIEIERMDVENIRAALQLGASKWGSVNILRATEKEREIIFRIAAAEKIKLAGAEPPPAPRQKFRI